MLEGHADCHVTSRWWLVQVGRCGPAARIQRSLNCAILSNAGSASIARIWLAACGLSDANRREKSGVGKGALVFCPAPPAAGGRSLDQAWEH